MLAERGFAARFFAAERCLALRFVFFAPGSG
jgi:hypothetical protein